MLSDIDDGGYVPAPFLDEESRAILKEARADITAYYAQIFGPKGEDE